MARQLCGDAVYFGELAIEDEFKEYVKMITDSYAARGENCQFELHRSPSISFEQFEIVIQAHGLKLSSEMAGVPLVHFVYWNRESDYFKTHLASIVDAAQEKKATRMREELQKLRRK